MNRFQISPEHADIALRAMRTVAVSDGDLHLMEEKLLVAAAKSLERPEWSLPLITPEEVAEAVDDAVARERLVQALCLMSILDGDLLPVEIAQVESFASALGIEDTRLRNLRQIHGRHLRLLQADLIRRSPVNATMARDAWEKEGVRGLWRFFAGTYNLRHDPEEAWSYKELGLLPEGTLGRAYWTFMTSRRFPFPGEPGLMAFPRELVRHDLGHLLSGYGTDITGECENAAFVAGSLQHDPFAYVFMVAVHTHLDIEVFPNDPSQGAMCFDPERVIPALERGLQVKRDIYSMDWDYWQDFPRPLEEVRADFGVPPKVSPPSA